MKYLSLIKRFFLVVGLGIAHVCCTFGEPLPLIIPPAQQKPPTLLTKPVLQSDFAKELKQRMETIIFAQLLGEIHYVKIPLQNVDFPKFLEDYMQELDANKLVFLQSDVKQFQMRFASSLDILLKGGSLMPAFDIFQAYKDLVEQRIALVLKRLDRPFDLNTKDVYNLDRQKIPWAMAAKELDAIWENYLKYELINELLYLETKAETAKKKALEKAKRDKAVSKKTGAKASKKTPAPKLAKKPAKPAKSTKPADVMSQAIEKMRERYKQREKIVREMEDSQIQEMFLTKLANMYDPHSSFLSTESLEDFSILIHNLLFGIGAVLGEKDGYCTIVSLIPGGPAEKSKQLKPGDKILAVAQGDSPPVNIYGMKSRQFVRLIRGPKGTKVRLTVQSVDGDDSMRKEVVLIRDEIKLTSQMAQAKLYEITCPGDECGRGRRQKYLIGVIDVPMFYGKDSEQVSETADTTTDVKELIEKLKKMNCQGIIVDLRRNGGGLLTEAIRLSGLFIAQNPVVQVRDSTGKITKYSDKTLNIVWKGPLIVLTSRGSASASEIFAGALQVHQRSITVGDPTTHGKGTVQVLLEMDRVALPQPTPTMPLGAAKITFQKYYLSDGRSPQLEGVHSEIVLPSINPFLPIGETDLPNPLKSDTIAPVLTLEPPFKYFNPVPKSLIETLKKNSLHRQETLDEFKVLREKIDFIKKKINEKQTPINLVQRKAMLDADKKFQERMKKALKRFKEDFPHKDVLLNLALKAKASSKEDASGKEDPAKKTKAKSAKNPLDEQDPLEEGFSNVDFDLKESLRIMSDWLSLETSAQTPSQTTTSQLPKK